MKCTYSDNFFKRYSTNQCCKFDKSVRNKFEFNTANLIPLLYVIPDKYENNAINLFMF